MMPHCIPRGVLQPLSICTLNFIRVVVHTIFFTLQQATLYGIVIEPRDKLFIEAIKQIDTKIRKNVEVFPY